MAISQWMAVGALVCLALSGYLVHSRRDLTKDSESYLEHMGSDSAVEVKVVTAERSDSEVKDHDKHSHSQASTLGSSGSLTQIDAIWGDSHEPTMIKPKNGHIQPHAESEDLSAPLSVKGIGPDGSQKSALPCLTCQTWLCNMSRPAPQSLRQLCFELYYFQRSVMSAIVPKITAFLRKGAWITANMITISDVVWPCIVGWAVAKQRTGVFYAAVLLQTIADNVDGCFARTYHETSLLGQVLDSLVDNLTNVIIILGNIVVHQNWKMFIVLALFLAGNVADVFFYVPLFQAIAHFTQFNSLAFRVLLYHATAWCTPQSLKQTDVAAPATITTKMRYLVGLPTPSLLLPRSQAVPPSLPPCDSES